MAILEIAVRMEPATGQSIECWLSQTMSISGTGGLFSSAHSHLASALRLFEAASVGSLLISTGSQASTEPLLTLNYSRAVSAEPVLALTDSEMVSAGPNSLASLIAYGRSTTDPEARLRLRKPELLDWTKSLHDLSTVTRMILPGIRELTEAEQRNLRGIYKKLRRKA